MNIFFLDRSPIKAAKYLCDKHVCKMIIETTQILSTVIRLHAEERGITLFGSEDLYQITHRNHPCIKWARKSVHNFNWLVTHGLGICSEYRTRYNKTHKCEKIICACSALAFLNWD